MLLMGLKNKEAEISKVQHVHISEWFYVMLKTFKGLKTRLYKG